MSLAVTLSILLKSVRLPGPGKSVEVSDQCPERKQIAHCRAGEKLPLTALSLPKGTPCTVLIGPEGDFSEEEVDMALAAGYEPVSLGPSRLRTETAALTAVTLLNLLHSKQELLYSEKK